jgi:hypothetical protein
MSDDFYAQSARRRYEQLQAERAAALADLQAHKSNGDADAAAYSVQQVADTDAALANLQNLYSRYQQSQTPPAQPVVSAEERAARPADRMDWQDVVELARGSRYAKNIKPNDPALVAGWNEANRRRQRGE